MRVENARSRAESVQRTWSKGNRLPVLEWGLTPAHTSLRPEALCAGAAARLLQSGKRSQMVRPVSSWPLTSRPSEVRTWDISVSP